MVVTGRQGAALGRIACGDPAIAELEFTWLIGG
jgi:hypothetical protein